MERVELFTVTDTSWLPAKDTQLLILRPDFPVTEEWRRLGKFEHMETVTIVRPDGQQTEAVAHISTAHKNYGGAHVPIEMIWRITVWFTDRPKEDVPVGSRILVREEIRDAILARNVA